MSPLLPFAAGLLAGALGIKLLKTVKTPDLGPVNAQLGRAQARLRDATVSGLSAIEQSSAQLRTKLTPEPAPAPEAKPVRAKAAKRAAAPKAAVAAAPKGRRGRKKAAAAPETGPQS